VDRDWYHAVTSALGSPTHDTVTRTNLTAY
jgi:hypothetical protein